MNRRLSYEQNSDDVSTHSESIEKTLHLVNSSCMISNVYDFYYTTAVKDIHTERRRKCDAMSTFKGLVHGLSSTSSCHYFLLTPSKNFRRFEVSWLTENPTTQIDSKITKSTIFGIMRDGRLHWHVSSAMSTVIISKASSPWNRLLCIVQQSLERYGLFLSISRAILIPSQLLLRLERYPHRMNFAKGILEVRKQHYKHLKSIIVSSKCTTFIILLST